MVTAYNTRTRVFQDIPEHWIDHPIWGEDWTLTPPPEARAPRCWGQEGPPAPPDRGAAPPPPLPEGD